MVVAFFIALITVEPRDSISYAILPESTQRTSSPTLPHQRKELTEPDLSGPETLKAGNCYTTITSTRTPTVKLSSRTSLPTSQRREAWWDSQETERSSPKVCYLHKSKSSFPALREVENEITAYDQVLGDIFPSINWIDLFIVLILVKYYWTPLLSKSFNFLNLTPSVNDFAGCLLIIPTDAGSRYNTASHCCRYCSS